jgi:FkbM family methyltransferase
MWAQQRGLVRSLLIYYGLPGRNGRLRNFYSQFIQPNDLCFDIGAHVGNWLRAWAGLGARIVAVESQPQMMQWLKKMYGESEAASGEPHITLIEQAVGAKIGSATLYISRRTPTVSTLSTKWMTAVQRDPLFCPGGLGHGRDRARNHIGCIDCAVRPSGLLQN